MFMDKIYFCINGSSTPFWRKENIDNYGGVFYSDFLWPENLPIQIKDLWAKIRTLYYFHDNPIDKKFPSFWNQSMCDLFNNLVLELYKSSIDYFHDFEILNKSTILKEDIRLRDYRVDPLKHHLGLNKRFNDKESLIYFLNENPEQESVLMLEHQHYQKIQISYKEYKAFNRVSLNFGKFHDFKISLCPYSNRIYLAIINTGGHATIFEAMRIERKDIFEQEEKLIELIEKYLEF